MNYVNRIVVQSDADWSFCEVVFALIEFLAIDLPPYDVIYVCRMRHMNEWQIDWHLHDKMVNWMDTRSCTLTNRSMRLRTQRVSHFHESELHTQRTREHISNGNEINHFHATSNDSTILLSSTDSFYVFVDCCWCGCVVCATHKKNSFFVRNRESCQNGVKSKMSSTSSRVAMSDLFIWPQRKHDFSGHPFWTFCTTKPQTEKNIIEMSIRQILHRWLRREKTYKFRRHESRTRKLSATKQQTPFDKYEFFIITRRPNKICGGDDGFADKRQKRESETDGTQTMNEFIFGSPVDNYLSCSKPFSDSHRFELVLRSVLCVWTVNVCEFQVNVSESSNCFGSNLFLQLLSLEQ